MNKSYSRSEVDIRACIGKLTSARGLPTVLQLLERYNATRICEVPTSHHSEFIDQCEFLLTATEYDEFNN